MKINYNNKTFKVENSDNPTFFYYKQEGDIVWGEYKEGGVVKGSLIAKIDKKDVMRMHYQHLNEKLEFKLGKCISIPEILNDGRIRIHEEYESVGTETINKGKITLIEIQK